MNSIRKVLGLLAAALMLSAFAMPASAGKTFYITGVPPGPLAAGSNTLSITFVNTGNSNPNSLEFDVQSGPVVITSATVPGGINGTVINSGKGVQFTNLSPVKTSITVTVNVTVTTSCASGPAQWFAHMWTGSPTNPSVTFTFTADAAGTQPIPPAAYPSSTVASLSCTISFFTQPADAFAGSKVTTLPFNSAGAKVQVKLLPAPSPAVTPTVSTTCAVSASATATDGSGLSTLTLTSTGTGAESGCQISASASGYTPSPAMSSPFNIFKPDGTLGCDSSNNFAHDSGHTDANFYDPNNDGPFYGTQGWGLRRHNNTISDPNATNPDCPSVIPYVFTFDGTTSAFIADKLGQSVIVEYVLVLPNTSVTGWPPARQPKFAWGFSTLPPDGAFTDGLVCNNDNVDATSMPLTVKMCGAQQGWVAISPGVVQYFLKVIDSDGYSRP